MFHFSIFLTGLIYLRPTTSLTTYKKVPFPRFYACFSFPTRCRFNCSFELPVSCTLTSVGDYITVSIQLSRESELHFWNVRKIKCKLDAFLLAGLKGNSLTEYKTWREKKTQQKKKCCRCWCIVIVEKRHFFPNKSPLCWQLKGTVLSVKSLFIICRFHTAPQKNSSLLYELLYKLNTLFFSAQIKVTERECAETPYD